MNKKEFLERLESRLRACKVGGIDEITAEYAEHFTYKEADGYSEEEIAKKLGDPETLAGQFISGDAERKMPGKKIITVTGLVFSDIFAGMFFILLFSWVIVLGALTLALLALGVCLMANANPYGILPPIPYLCAALFALSSLSLAVLSFAGTVYCAAYSRQLFSSYMRFHSNCFAAARGKRQLPPVSTHPKFAPANRRRLRSLALVSLTVFAVCFLLTYIVSAICAGSLGFWHAWNWFIK